MAAPTVNPYYSGSDHVKNLDPQTGPPSGLLLDPLLESLLEGLLWVDKGADRHFFFFGNKMPSKNLFCNSFTDRTGSKTLFFLVLFQRTVQNVDPQLNPLLDPLLDPLPPPHLSVNINNVLITTGTVHYSL